jgi:hypothetical protein
MAVAPKSDNHLVTPELEHRLKHFERRAMGILVGVNAVESLRQVRGGHAIAEACFWHALENHTVRKTAQYFRGRRRYLGSQGLDFVVTVSDFEKVKQL